MKDATTNCSDEKAADDAVNSLDRVVLAVVVTGLLYWFNIGWRHSDPTAAISDAGESIVNLSEATADRVLQEVSAQSGLPKSDLQILKTGGTIQESFCHAIADTDACETAVEPAVQILVASKEQRWVYRLNQSGTKVQLEKLRAFNIQ